MNFMKETIHIPIDKMSPQTRSQTALIKNFQQNAKRLFNFIPKDDTSIHEYRQHDCLHQYWDCETDNQIFVRIQQLHLMWVRQNLIDANKYYEGNARTAHRYPRIKTCAFTGQIYNCPDWLANEIQTLCFQRDELRKMLREQHTKMTKKLLGSDIMPKPCDPPCETRLMSGRSWWKMMGYGGQCGCAWAKIRDPTNNFIPSHKELKCYKYVWNMPSYSYLY